jgi:hypothetical protein
VSVALRPRRPAAGTVAEETRAYVERHPSIRHALRDDLVNFVQLAQKIGSERGWRRDEAVAMALRRLQREIQAEVEARGPVRHVVGMSRLEVHSGVAIVRLRQELDVLDRLLAIGARLTPTHPGRPVFQIYQGTRAYTVLCDEQLLPSLLDKTVRPAVLSMEEGLATIAFHSTPEVEETPGILATMGERLAEWGVNCLETVSVHTESIFVFRESEVIRAYGALSSLIPTPGPKHAARGGHRPERTKRRRG